MWAGCGPGALLSVMTTLVPAPSAVSTAVPDCPELFWGDRAMVMLCWASMFTGRSAIVVRATATAPVNGTHTALTIPPPRNRWIDNLGRLERARRVLADHRRRCARCL